MVRAWHGWRGSTGAGADGWWRRRWSSPFGITAIEVAATIADVLADRIWTVIAVDMPIGLPADGAPRVADVETRRRLGSAAVVGVPDAVPGGARRDHVRRGAGGLAGGDRPRPVDPGVEPRAEDPRARRRDGAGRQDEGARDPSGARVRPPGRRADVAPEADARRAWPNGSRVVGAPPPTPRGAARDDVLDAMALAYAAAAMVTGDAWCLGDGAVDARGLRMEIWG